jgi:hypothetical protein
MKIPVFLTSKKISWLDFIFISLAILIIFGTRFYFFDIVGAIFNPEHILPDYFPDYLKQSFIYAPADRYLETALQFKKSGTFGLLVHLPPIIPIFDLFVWLLDQQFSGILFANFVLLFLAWGYLYKVSAEAYGRLIAFILLFLLMLGHHPTLVLRTMPEGVAYPFILFLASQVIAYCRSQDSRRLLAVLFLSGLAPLVRNAFAELIPLAIIFLLIDFFIKQKQAVKWGKWFYLKAFLVLLTPALGWSSYTSMKSHNVDPSAFTWFCLASRIMIHADPGLRWQDKTDVHSEEISLIVDRIQGEMRSGKFIVEDEGNFWQAYKTIYEHAVYADPSLKCPLSEHPFCLPDNSRMFRIFHEYGVNYFTWRLLSHQVELVAPYDNENYLPYVSKISKLFAMDVVRNKPLMVMKISWLSFKNLLTSYSSLGIFHGKIADNLFPLLFMVLFFISTIIILFIPWIKISSFLVYLIPGWWFGAFHISHMLIVAIFQGYHDRYLYLTLDSSYWFVLILTGIGAFKFFHEYRKQPRALSENF